jgi:post-segregation antitoxin (ccd killing protein)
MKDHYDFTNGVRGKFYQPNANTHLPIYLDLQVQAYLAAKANAKGIDLSQLVNEPLQRDIDIAEAVR